MWPTAAAVLLLSSLQATDFNAEGLKALDAQHYEEAAQSFTKALDADPKDYSAHFNLALAYSFISGKEAEAEAEYRKTLEIKPDLWEAHMNLGVLLLEKNDAKGALPHLQSAVEVKPKEFRPNYYLAESLYQTGDIPNAEKHYQTALELNPKSAGAHLGLGRCAIKQDRPADAIPHYQEAAELSPKYQDSLLELAEVLEQKKMSAEAIGIYQQFPENPGARERLGELLLEAGKPAEAIPHLEWAVAKSPTAANRVALAMAYLRDRQPEKGIETVRLALTAEPQNYDLHMTLGRLLRDQKNFAEAAAEFRRAIQLKPNSVESWTELSTMLVSLEYYPQALEALDRVKTLGGETAGHVYLRAIVLDKAKQYAPALASYKEFLEMSGGKFPDEEFKARQRARIIQNILNKR